MRVICQIGKTVRCQIGLRVISIKRDDEIGERNGIKSIDRKSGIK